MNYYVNRGAKLHINIMELLVQEEIDKQLKYYPEKIKKYINKVEVATYALNRLPALYASSLVGKEHQKRIGKQEYKEQITLAVRRALAAIERDPIKKVVPLVSEDYTQQELAKKSLSKLEIILKQKGIISNSQKLSWENLYRVLYPLVARLKSQNISKEEQEFAALTSVSSQLSGELSRGYKPSQRRR